MTGTVVSLASRRKRNHPPTSCCPCDPASSFTCYPHRLADLLARVEDVHGDVEQMRFCDWSTFVRLSDDIRDVLGGIVGECLPDERDAR